MAHDTSMGSELGNLSDFDANVENLHCLLQAVVFAGTDLGMTSNVVDVAERLV